MGVLVSVYMDVCLNASQGLPNVDWSECILE